MLGASLSYLVLRSLGAKSPCRVFIIEQSAAEYCASVCNFQCQCRGLWSRSSTCTFPYPTTTSRSYVYLSHTTSTISPLGRLLEIAISPALLHQSVCSNRQSFAKALAPCSPRPAVLKISTPAEGGFPHLSYQDCAIHQFTSCFYPTASETCSQSTRLESPRLCSINAALRGKPQPSLRASTTATRFPARFLLLALLSSEHHASTVPCPKRL